MTKSIQISGFVFAMLTCVAAQGSDWELEKTNNNPHIEVFTRAVEGHAIREFRGETELESSLDGVVALLKDVDNLPNWIYAMISIRLLARRSEQESITYSINKAGPFMSKRDSIVQSIISQNPQSKEVTVDLVGKPDFIPATPDNVRVRHLIGQWRLQPLPAGKVRVIYQVHADPAGKLPKMLINNFLIKSPLNTLKEMHRQIPLYQSANIDFIEEI